MNGNNIIYYSIGNWKLSFMNKCYRCDRISIDSIYSLLSYLITNDNDYNY